MAIQPSIGSSVNQPAAVRPRSGAKGERLPIAMTLADISTVRGLAHSLRAGFEPLGLVMDD
jgi:hypothetical protein